jgi:hypothetical protein
MLRTIKRVASFLSLFVLVGGLFVSVYLVQNRTELFPRAFGEPANLVVDFDDTSDASGSWRNFAQGGEEEVNMLSSVEGEVRGLSPEYIRIDHIYDYYNVVNRGADGRINFSWGELDAVVNSIRAAGAKPFLSLSYMPTVISRGNEVDLPRNWGEWELVVRSTVERYSGRASFNISDVYYEVWNEPDLFGDFKLYGEKNYLELYRHSANGAAAAQNVNNFKIGGPATTALYPNWFKDFISFVSLNDLRLDFYSWHSYSKELNTYEKNLQDIRIWQADFPQFFNLEILITEMGYSSENDPAYDTSLSAIHTIATIAQVEGVVDKAFSFEIKDGPNNEKFWGRWGMLTHDRHGTPQKKIRYSAFQFLNQMPVEQTFLVTGEGYWVKALGMTDGNVSKLLVVNYDSEGKHFETVPIKFVNLPNRNFTFVRTDFQGGTSRVDVEANSDEWETLELFSPNSAAIFEMAPR